MTTLKIIDGDITEQKVDVIVNAWNRNFIPFWLLIPQGVSRAIRKVSGNAPFWELRQRKLLNTGEAFWTSPGKHDLVKGIVHVAGINAFWIATEFSVRESTRNALTMVSEKGFKSVAFPVIGAGTGAFSADKAEQFMIEEINKCKAELDVILVKFRA